MNIFVNVSIPIQVDVCKKKRLFTDDPWQHVMISQIYTLCNSTLRIIVPNTTRISFQIGFHYNYSILIDIQIFIIFGKYPCRGQPGGGRKRKKKKTFQKVRVFSWFARRDL